MSWNSSASAELYFVDIATDSEFTDLVPAYTNLDVGNVTELIITGLIPSTEYFVRVRAMNDTGPSPNSVAGYKQFTTPLTPTALEPTSQSQNSFKANWTSVTGADSYELTVTNQSTESVVIGYPKIINHPTTEEIIVGLPNGTIFRYVVRALNQGGYSAYSNEKLANTLTADGTFVEPTVQTNSIVFDDVQDKALTISWQAGNGDHRMLVGRQGAPVTFFPVDGQSYNGSSDFSAGLDLGGGNKILYAGLFSTIMISGLQPATTYHFRVFEWKGNGTQANYLLTAATGNPVTKTTVDTEPVSQPSDLSFSSVSSTHLEGTFKAPDEANLNFLVLVRANTAPTESPQDGTSYEMNSNIGLSKVIYVGQSNTFSVANLNPSTNYHFVIFSFKGTGGTNNYLVSQPLRGNKSTVAVEPLFSPSGLEFFEVNETSMNIRFTTSAGSPSGYLVLQRTGSAPEEIPLDGQSYSDQLGKSKVVSFGNQNELELGNLQPQVHYHYAIYPFNGSGATINYLSANPLRGARSTLARQPTDRPGALSFGDVSTNSMSVTFQPATTAANYLILRRLGTSPTEIPSDGQSYSNVFGSSEVVYNGDVANFQSSGLLVGSRYFYKVFPYNGFGESSNYYVNEPVEGIRYTVTAAPVARPAFASSNSFTASWDPVFGAEKFKLEVSSNDFVGMIPSFPVADIVELEYFVSGLTPSTTYKFRVAAVNPDGDYSSWSNIITTSTSVTNLSIAPIDLQSFSGAMTIPINVNGGIGNSTATLFSKKITSEGGLVPTSVISSGNQFSFEVTDAMLDELGLEFYVIATDQAGAQDREPDAGSHFIYRNLPAESGLSIPFAPGFNGQQETYQMFSIPYNLNNKSITSIFDEISGGTYDPKQWRLFRYEQPAGNRENVTMQIEAGKGYWINMKEKVDIKIGAGNVVSAHQSAPFPLLLTPGWNQIGNPYPFAIDWSEVVTGIDNVDPELNFWSNGNYNQRVEFRPWEGAFVFNGNTGNTTVPVPVTARSNGRTQVETWSADLNEAQWKVNLQLSTGSMRQMAAIGMHPAASFSKDRFDRIALPRWGDFAEMWTYHTEFFSPHFATDVVPTMASHAWHFEVESNLEGEEGILTWDSSGISGSAQLLLLDVAEQCFVDMRVADSYVFKHQRYRPLRIVYQREGELLPGVTWLGRAYPNPFSGNVTIPVLIGAPNETVELNVYDALGRKIRTLRHTFERAGVQQFVWDGRLDTGEEVGNGLLLYRLNNGNQVERLIKQ